MSDGISADDRLDELLRQMREAANDAVSFTNDIDRDVFLADLRTQRAVVMSLMIAGEAATRIVADHPAFAEGQSDVPWRAMRGMRNRIAHGYFDIDLDIVWRTTRNELPKLVGLLEELQAIRDPAR